MSDQNVPVTKPASDLKLGDHVWTASLHPDLDGVAEVMFVHPYAEYSTDGVTVVLWYGGTTQVQAVHVAPARVVRMASAEEIAEAKAKANRDRVADELHRLANLIRGSEAPLRDGRMTVAQHLGDLTDLVKVGQALGLEVLVGHGTYRSVTWPKGHHPSDSGLHVTWDAYADDEPALASGRELSAADEATATGAREPLHTGEVTDNSLVPRPIAEHYETGGWKNPGPGGCGVECACSVTFGGFNSLDEAAEQLARHIEAEASA